jgi:23S rRNA (uracil1939-C5)-methyltransferase
MYKQKQVADILKRIGKIQLPEMFNIIGCDVNRQYRNKLEYTFSNKKFIPQDEFKKIKKGELPLDGTGAGVAGFHAKGVFDKVVEIDVCHLQPEPTNEIRKAIAKFAIENNLSFYDLRLHTGWLRTMQVRMATTGEIMVNLVLGYEDEKNQKPLMDFILHQFPQITTLLFTINIKKNDSLFDLKPKLYFGKGYIEEALEDFKFKIGPKSFFQTNTRQAEKLYQVIREFAELSNSQIVYDLYCGTGSIGIFVSKQAKQIIGVDLIEEAIADANENAALNNIHNARFFTGDVISICDDAFFIANGKPDVIITDPPRAGMHEKLVSKLMETEAPIIVYVSCNSATQARDIAMLNEKYSVVKIQPIDMFPHTHHIENIVQLKLQTL